MATHVSRSQPHYCHAPFLDAGDRSGTSSRKRCVTPIWAEHMGDFSRVNLACLFVTAWSGPNMVKWAMCWVFRLVAGNASLTCHVWWSSHLLEIFLGLICFLLMAVLPSSRLFGSSTCQVGRCFFLEGRRTCHSLDAGTVFSPRYEVSFSSSPC
jgi:hypothetical protein